MINAIIIDDEKMPRDTIKSILQEASIDIHILAEADSVKSGLICIKKYNPDLVFLDIDLKDGTGFELLKEIDEINFKLIFITGFSEYAIEAFKFCALDYILKPINTEELVKAVNRADKEIKLTNQSSKLDALFSNIKNLHQDSKKIVLKTQDSIHIINIQQIIRCQSDNAYVTFYLTDLRKIIVCNSLKEYEELLESYGFFRAHQSHLININHIVRFDKREGGCIILSDNSNIPVSQRKRNDLMQLFDKFV